MTVCTGSSYLPNPLDTEIYQSVASSLGGSDSLRSGFVPISSRSHLLSS